MINDLESKLERIDAEMKATQLTYEQLNSDYLALQGKLEASNEKYKFAALLMAEFLDDILEERQNILTMDS